MTRSLLKSSAIQGESPVEVVKKVDGEYPEYVSPIREAECGSHLDPILNTT